MTNLEESVSKLSSDLPKIKDNIKQSFSDAVKSDIVD